jgi:hypothetical protein
MLLRALNWQNAWRIRMVALALITLLVGVGSQVLVNTFAAESPEINITIATHVSEENVTTANGTQIGVCTKAEVHLSPALLMVLSKTDRPLRSLVHLCISSAGHLSLFLPSMNPDPISKDYPHLSRQMHQIPLEDVGH